MVGDGCLILDLMIDIAAALKERIPTTYNEETEDIKRAIETIVSGEQSDDALDFLKKYFSEEEMEMVQRMSTEELEKMRQTDSETLKKYQIVIDKIREISQKPIIISEALKYYEKKYPNERVRNPKRDYFVTLIKELASEGANEAIEDELKTKFNLSKDIIQKLIEVDDISSLRDNLELMKVFTNMAEKVSFSQTAEIYEELLHLSK